MLISLIQPSSVRTTEPSSVYTDDGLVVRRWFRHPSTEHTTAGHRFSGNSSNHTDVTKFAGNSSNHRHDRSSTLQRSPGRRCHLANQSCALALELSRNYRRQGERSQGKYQFSLNKRVLNHSIWTFANIDKHLHFRPYSFH